MLNLLLMAHLILIAMGTGLSFSNFVNIRLSQSQSGDIAKDLGLQRRTIAQIGDCLPAHRLPLHGDAYGQHHDLHGQYDAPGQA